MYIVFQSFPHWWPRRDLRIVISSRNSKIRERTCLPKRNFPYYRNSGRTIHRCGFHKLKFSFCWPAFIRMKQNPPAKGKYETVKQRFISRLELTEQAKMDQLLGSYDFGDLRPTQLSTKMQELTAGLNVNDSLLKRLFLQQQKFQLIYMQYLAWTMEVFRSWRRWQIKW